MTKIKEEIVEKPTGIMTDNEHKGAQEYEWMHTVTWLRGNISRLIGELNNNVGTKYWSGPYEPITNNLNLYFMTVLIFFKMLIAA